MILLHSPTVYALEVTADFICVVKILHTGGRHSSGIYTTDTGKPQRSGPAPVDTWVPSPHCTPLPTPAALHFSHAVDLGKSSETLLFRSFYA